MYLIQKNKNRIKVSAEERYLTFTYNDFQYLCKASTLLSAVSIAGVRVTIPGSDDDSERSMAVVLEENLFVFYCCGDFVFDIDPLEIYDVLECEYQIAISVDAVKYNTGLLYTWMDALRQRKGTSVSTKSVLDIFTESLDKVLEYIPVSTLQSCDTKDSLAIVLKNAAAKAL